MHANTTVAIVNTAMVILIGFLCWFFGQWWPVFLVFAFMHSESSTKEGTKDVVHRADEP